LEQDHSDRVAVISDVYADPANFWETGVAERFGSHAEIATDLPTPSVVSRTPGAPIFRGCNLWDDGLHLVQLAEVAPGDRKYLHRHRHLVETMWLILEGEGEFYPDLDAVIPVKAGMICHSFPLQWHGLGNTGDVPLRYLVVEGPFLQKVIEFAET
jgi:mannose-6-phosphate isomerase-like protein (cupin superfamily)